MIKISGKLGGVGVKLELETAEQTAKYLTDHHNQLDDWLIDGPDIDVLEVKRILES